MKEHHIDNIFNEMIEDVRYAKIAVTLLNKNK